MKLKEMKQYLFNIIGKNIHALYYKLQHTGFSITVKLRNNYDMHVMFDISSAQGKLEIYIDHVGVNFVIAKYICPNATLAEMMNHVITDYTSDNEDERNEMCIVGNHIVHTLETVVCDVARMVEIRMGSDGKFVTRIGFVRTFVMGIGYDMMVAMVAHRVHHGCRKVVAHMLDIFRPGCGLSIRGGISGCIWLDFGLDCDIRLLTGLSSAIIKLGAILWNPSVRKYLGIELPYMPRRPAIEKIIWGFGVWPDTLDPTLLNISMLFYGDGPWHVVMYTLNSDTWTFLGNYRMPRVGIRIKRSWGLAVVGSCIFWGCSKTFFNDDGSSYKLYMLFSFDFINLQFNVLDIPTELKNQLPIPFYISKLGNSLVISGNLIYYENRYLCAWSLKVEPMVVTSWSVLFIIPSQNITKLIGFTREEDPIVEVDSGQEMVQTLQVYDRPSQQFHNVGIEANGGSFFIGPYKESLILLNGR
ncbi:hypothetical protein Tco_0938035 [Tanacetum coccineum]|uniref:Uncharacterized protein n=1 Tax=Tanacetum coccineum TaxID=301880 RepID=A0ABQ5DGL2_9ASTR